MGWKVRKFPMEQHDLKMQTMEENQPLTERKMAAPI
jgi:hypothetical protein